VHRSCGRPRIDETATAVVWDVDDVLADQLAWLRLLAANRPGLEIVLLESFPRGDTAAAAIQPPLFAERTMRVSWEWAPPRNTRKSPLLLPSGSA
jgi:hypothetical protein